MRQAKMREPERAARQLGVTSTTLRQHGRRDRVSTAARLGGQPRAVRDRGIKPGEVGDLLVARPGWLIAEREWRQVQTARAAEDKLRRELADALVASAHEVWFQELKHAVTGADIDAVDAWWALEVSRARQEARRLAGELAPGRVRARIGRERDDSDAAAGYRASRFLRRALEGGDGGQVRDP
jgi:hypothetical protein